MLYQTEMVQALLDNRKTKTRRTKGLEENNENPDLWRYEGLCTDKEDSYFGCHFFEYLDINGKSLGKYNPIEPKYNVGDILWVRENLYQNGELGLEYSTDNEAIDEDIIPVDYGPYGGEYSFRTIPNIHMPKWACRIFLKVKSVKVERLQDISENDAIKEGIKPTWITENQSETKYKNYINDGTGSKDPIESFTSLWIEINGEDSWNKNPFVWVIEFEKIEKPNDFIL